MTDRPKRIIIHHSGGTSLPSSNQHPVDYSSSGLSGTDEDDIYFDSESYLSGDAGIDRHSTILRGGNRMKSNMQQVAVVTESVPIRSSNDDIEIVEIQQSKSYPPNLAMQSDGMQRMKKLNKKKNLQYQQDKAMKKLLKEVKDSNNFYTSALSDITTEEDYKSLFVIPYEAIFSTDHFRNVIEPALKEFEHQLPLPTKHQQSYKNMTPKERYQKLVEKQAKEALQRQYDVEFISLVEEILIPFINQERNKEEQDVLETTTENNDTENAGQFKGNFLVLSLSDGLKRFLTHAICQYYGLKSFSTDFNNQRVTVISKRRRFVENDEYPVYDATNLLSTYLAQFKQEKPSYMVGNDLFKHEGNEIHVLDKKSFVKHYRKKKKKQQTE